MYKLFGGGGGKGDSGDVSQAFLDEVGHQDLRSLLVLHQDVMRGRDLVSVEPVQQCHTDHSSWREKGDHQSSVQLVNQRSWTHVYLVFIYFFTNIKVG